MHHWDDNKPSDDVSDLRHDLISYISSDAHNCGITSIISINQHDSCYETTLSISIKVGSATAIT